MKGGNDGFSFRCGKLVLRSGGGLQRRGVRWLGIGIALQCGQRRKEEVLEQLGDFGLADAEATIVVGTQGKTGREVEDASEEGLQVGGFVLVAVEQATKATSVEFELEQRMGVDLGTEATPLHVVTGVCSGDDGVAQSLEVSDDMFDLEVRLVSIGACKTSWAVSTERSQVPVDVDGERVGR